MKKINTLLIVFTLFFLCLITFLIQTHSPENIGKFYGPFGDYIGGVVGTLVATWSGYLIYITFQQQKFQNAEKLVLEYITLAFREKPSELGQFYLKLVNDNTESIRYFHKVPKDQEELKKRNVMFIDSLATGFFESVSVTIASPILKNEFDLFFNKFEIAVQLISNFNFDKESEKNYFNILMSFFNKEEIVIISYYYYILFDFSNKLNKLTKHNFVLSSRMIEEVQIPSNYFIFSFDPRSDYFKEFENETYLHKISKIHSQKTVDESDYH